MNIEGYIAEWNGGIFRGSAVKFAEAIGYSESTVSSLINSKEPPKSEKLIIACLKELKISRQKFMACFLDRAVQGAATAAHVSNLVPVPGVMELREVNYYGELSAGRRNYIFDGVPLSTENIFMKIPSGLKVGTFKVTGDCMDDNTPEAIRAGDKILVAEQDWADPNDIIVCTLDGALMVKQLKHQDGKTLLQPRNPKHKAIVVTGEFKILGVVLRSYRDYKR